MAATYVTAAELRATLGIGTLYSDTVVEDVCQTAENIVKDKLWFNKSYNSGHSNEASTGTLYFTNPHPFYVGQTVVIGGNGSKHNGNKTITKTTWNTITYAITGSSNTPTPYHPVNPWGEVAADTYTDFAVIPEVRQATLMIAVDVWQARQTTASGGVTPDGYTPSPYKMGNTLMARVRSLLTKYLDPNGLVG